MRRQRAIAIILNHVIHLYYDKLSIKTKCDRSNDPSKVIFGKINLDEFTVENVEFEINYWLRPSVKKHRQVAIDAGLEYIRMINELRQVK